LQHIHYFRGIAIIFIVISHALLVPLLAPVKTKDPVYGLVYLFFSNATVFFALISGFLFQYNSDNSTFSYSTMMKKKFLYLFVPLVFMSIPAMIAIAYESPGSPGHKLFAGAAGAAKWAFMRSPLWFIFFILIAFTASPLILRFVHWRWSFPVTMLAMSLGFFFFPRTLPVWPGVFPYFLPVFVLGAIMSYRYGQFRVYIQRYFLYCGILALMLMLLVILAVLVTGETDRTLVFGFNRSVARGVQSELRGYFKIFLALFLWGLLIRLEHRESRILDLFANYSFGIYFIHSYFITLSIIFYAYLWPSSRPFAYLMTLGYCIIWPLLALAIAMLIKRVSGRYSRYVAGV